jgi:hypothetical protein
MKPQALISSLVIVTTMLFLTSCKKGDTGPAGADGLPGIAGINGNANVKTDTFSVQSSAWTFNSNYWVGTSPNVSQSQTSKYFEHVNTAITDSILSLGAVLVYYTNPSSIQPVWTPLPISWLDNFTGNYTFNYAYALSKEKITMHFFFARVAGGTIPVLSTFTVPTIRVKVVCIAGKLGYSPDQINRLRKLSYRDAQSVLHFAD